MDRFALLALLRAKPGKENELEDVSQVGSAPGRRRARHHDLVRRQAGAGQFGIFDTFPDEAGRNAHLNGPIAKALMAKADELLADPPQIEKLEILAAKAPGPAVKIGFGRTVPRRRMNPWLCAAASPSARSAPRLSGVGAGRSARSPRSRSPLRTNSSSAPTFSRWTSRPASSILPTDAILAHVQAAASAVATYYGRFPVARARLLLVPVAGRQRHSAGNHLARHERISGIHAHPHRPAHHNGRPGRRLDDDPRTGAHGFSLPAGRSALDGRRPGHLRRTHRARADRGTGGAPDLARHGARHAQGRAGRMAIEGWIRRIPGVAPTGAARSSAWWPMSRSAAKPRIARACRTRCAPSSPQGGTIDHEWPLEQALAIGDRATGTHVLTRMYAEWKDKPVPVDLPKLWERSGDSLGRPAAQSSSWRPRRWRRSAKRLRRAKRLRYAQHPAKPCHLARSAGIHESAEAHCDLRRGSSSRLSSALSASSGTSHWRRIL